MQIMAERTFFRQTTRKIFPAALLACIIFLSAGSPAPAEDHPILYFFWGDGCPHCEKTKEFLPKLQEKYPEIEMRWFETWNHEQFTLLADRMRKTFEIKTSSVPMLFLGDWNMVGYQKDDTSGRQIEAQVVRCIQEGCFDAISKLGPLQVAWLVQDEAKRGSPGQWELFPATIAPRKEMGFQVEGPEQAEEATSDMNASSSPDNALAGAPGPDPTVQPGPELVQIAPTKAPTIQEEPAESARFEDDEGIIDLPWLGKVDVKQIGLPVFTLIIGGLDGFNPCAMWVLCFLLTLTIYAKSRAKILAIGSIFVVASGVIYFFFMAAWLNLFIIVGYVKYLRITVALVAIVMGVINCKDFFFFKKGISLTIPESAQSKLFKRMRSVVNASAWPAMVLGTIFLAVTANLIELLCTAGFPAIYTRILTLHDLSTAQYYMYLVFYNVVYVIPLAVIVSIFGWKMGGRKLSEKEGRILKLVGGALMLALGLILLFKPQILMF